MAIACKVDQAWFSCGRYDIGMLSDREMYLVIHADGATPDEPIVFSGPPGELLTLFDQISERMSLTWLLSGGRIDSRSSMDTGEVP